MITEHSCKVVPSKLSFSDPYRRFCWIKTIDAYSSGVVATTVIMTPVTGHFHALHSRLSQLSLHPYRAPLNSENVSENCRASVV